MISIRLDSASVDSTSLCNMFGPDLGVIDIEIPAPLLRVSLSLGHTLVNLYG